MTTEKRKIERRRCPHCTAPLLVPIVRTDCPDEETLRRAQRGELVIGGCLIAVDDECRDVTDRWRCKNCGQDCVKPMRTRAQQASVEHMLMLHRMRKGQTPFRVEERGLMGCMLLPDWELAGEFRTFAEAIAAVREIKKGSTRELRIIGPSGAIRYQRGQRPVGPRPFERGIGE